MYVLINILQSSQTDEQKWREVSVIANGKHQYAISQK